MWVKVRLGRVRAGYQSFATELPTNKGLGVRLQDKSWEHSKLIVQNCFFIIKCKFVTKEIQPVHQNIMQKGARAGTSVRSSISYLCVSSVLIRQKRTQELKMKN